MPLARVITVETTLTNTLSDVARVPRLLAELARTHTLPSGVVSDVNVALDEVLSNIINYAYTDEGTHEIRVRLTLSEDAIMAEVDDDGRPFDPLSVPPPDLEKPIAERMVGGLGIHFIRNIMTEVSYSRAAGHNRLMLKRSLMR